MCSRAASDSDKTSNDGQGMTEPVSGAQYVVETLARHQVTTVFGYPGGTIMPVYDALYGSPVEHVLCRHEQGASLAAVGYARASGRVGVCIATSGPGSTNLITGLADAMLDSIPIVAITGQVPLAAMGSDAFQEVDILGVSLGVTKHSYLVTSIDELPEVLDEAFHLSKTGRPGPVLVDIPKDIQQALMIQPAQRYPAPHGVAMPDREVIEQARHLMQQAEHPIAYVGGGVGIAGAVSELRQFLKETGMPSVTTLKGIGVVPDHFEQHLGMLGMHGNQAANLAIQQCDLLVCIGARFDDRVTGKLDQFAPHARVIHMDIDPAEHNKRRQADISITDNLSDVLPELTETLTITEWQSTCRALRQRYAWRYDHPGEGIYAPRLLKQLNHELHADAVISCDVGQHQMWVAQHITFDKPENHLSSGGLGTMGFGLPAAIGAQLARPDALVINVTGDGSFMMNVQELATIRRKQLPIKILLLDNERLGMVRQWQELFFDGRYSETNLSDNPDFVAMAGAFGIPGETIWRKDQVSEALNRLLKAEGAYLLHVAIDAADNVWPLVPPGAANHEMLEEGA